VCSVWGALAPSAAELLHEMHDHDKSSAKLHPITVSGCGDETATVGLACCQCVIGRDLLIPIMLTVLSNCSIPHASESVCFLLQILLQCLKVSVCVYYYVYTNIKFPGGAIKEAQFSVRGPDGRHGGTGQGTTRMRPSGPLSHEFRANGSWTCVAIWSEQLPPLCARQPNRSPAPIRGPKIMASPRPSRLGCAAPLPRATRMAGRGG
jgi:hypothetical protein